VTHAACDWTLLNSKQSLRQYTPATLRVTPIRACFSDKFDVETVSQHIGVVTSSRWTHCEGLGAADASMYSASGRSDL
jgi:hypothetical protein